MKCNGCGNKHAVFIKTRFDNAYGDDKNKQIYEVCDKCGQVVSKGSPDVYFREPVFECNLGDEAHPYGQWVTSKAHKAAIMRAQGMREKGDRIHGARTAFDPNIFKRSQEKSKLNLNGDYR